MRLNRFAQSLKKMVFYFIFEYFDMDDKSKQ